MYEHAYTDPVIVSTESEKKYDPVNVPFHYNQGKIEVIDVIMALELDACEANVAKYCIRHKYKNGIEDLKKALRYLELITHNYSKWYKYTKVDSPDILDPMKEAIIDYAVLLDLDYCEAEILLCISQHSYLDGMISINQCKFYINRMMDNYKEWYAKNEDSHTR